MGISAVVGAQATVLFVAFLCLRGCGIGLLVLLPLLHASLVGFLVAIASHPCVNLPLLLGKRSDGTFPTWSLIVFGPFLLFVQIYVFVKRFKRRKESPYSEISEGLYVGCWPSLGGLPPGDPAIIDCTCELPRSSYVSRNSYLCIATWDTRSPQPADIESAVRWASRQKAQKKPVYIHCAFGHGRSVSVMCAVMVAFGLAEDWKNAEKLIKERRPFIHMNNLHRKSLREWSRYRLTFL